MNSILRALILLFTVTTLYAQDQTKSPYSALGLGDMQFGGNAMMSALGQTSQGIRRASELNVMNPASYSFLKLTTVETGFRYTLGTIQNSSGSSNIDNFTYGYLNVGIPISQAHRIGLAFGLEPFSSVGYNVSSNVTNTTKWGTTFPSNLVTAGSGGLSKFFLGGGMALLKDFSIGANFSYVWGKIQSKKSIYIPPEYNMYNVEEIFTSYVGGFNFDYGFQYHTIFKDRDSIPKYKLVIGATASLPTIMNGTQDFSARTMGVGGILGTKDTVVYQNGIAGQVNFPLVIRAGISFEEIDHWLVCADVSYAKWSQYRFFNSTDSLKDLLGFSFGLAYTPSKKFEEKNYFNKIEYRIGGRYDNGYLSVNKNDISTIGFSAGLGLPLGLKIRSRLNITGEYYIRGTMNDGLIRESYFRLILGVTFSDKWFDRYKYR
ncbi:MAG: hypothetical protein ACHQK8_05285 [Bacteroidia bacterium]